jgi:hypothetical protein
MCYVPRSSRIISPRGLMHHFGTDESRALVRDLLIDAINHTRNTFSPLLCLHVSDFHEKLSNALTNDFFSRRTSKRSSLEIHVSFDEASSPAVWENHHRTGKRANKTFLRLPSKSIDRKPDIDSGRIPLGGEESGILITESESCKKSKAIETSEKL